MIMTPLDTTPKQAVWKAKALLAGVLFLFLIGSLSGHARSEGKADEPAPPGMALDAVPGLPGEENAGEETRFEPLPGSNGQPPRFHYKSGEMRDPFLSFVNPGEKDLRGVPPLQRVAVSELKLIGVAWGSGRISAMLQTPDGRTYPVSKGTRVGNNRGRVGHIGEESLTVTEPYLNVFGRTALRQVVMKLYKNKEE